MQRFCYKLGNKMRKIENEAYPKISDSLLKKYNRDQVSSEKGHRENESKQTCTWLKTVENLRICLKTDQTTTQSLLIQIFEILK